MSLVTLDELRTLAEQTQGPCVSMFMPTYRMSAETQQNPIRFKNILKRAEAGLQHDGFRSSEIDHLLNLVQALSTPEFWEHQNAGLAIFVAPNFFRYYRLPLDFEEKAIVGDRFHLKPLMPLLIGDGTFYILTLSQQDIRLLEASRYSVQEVDVEGMPKSLDEALRYDKTAKSGQFRIGTTAGNMARPSEKFGVCTRAIRCRGFPWSGQPRSGSAPTGYFAVFPSSGRRRASVFATA